MTLTKLSLFSGIGGDDLASDWAGIKTICFVEKEKYCRQVLKKQWPGIPIIEDVKDVTKEVIKTLSGTEYVDIISGGDPCQPRSLAGQRRGRADDRDLWPDMFRVIQQFKPSWVVNENPTGRLTMDFYEVLSDLASEGYEARSFVIPACAVNAWHRRDRVFIIANNLRKQTHGNNKGRFFNQPARNVKSDTNNQSIGLQRFIRPFNEKGQETKQQSNGLYRAWTDNWIEAATSFCRVVHGISHRVDRIKALGNAVVPQQIYPIYKAIKEIENE